MLPQRLSIARIVSGIRMVLPWYTAKAVFKPLVGSGRRDELLDRLAFWRSVVGLLVVVFATIDWRLPENVLLDTYGKVAQTAFLSLGVAVVLWLGICAINPGRARIVRRTVRVVVRIMSAGLAIFILPLVFLSVGLYAVGAHLRPEVTGSGVFWALLPFFWLLVHALCVVYWAARTCLWISDVHPLLGPLGSAVLTALVTVNETLEGDSKGVPYSLWLVLNLFGLATALILAHAEYRHIRSTGVELTADPDSAPASADR
ncbi:hypothetical protein [Allokutzneria oryzae]|uniref:Uncharacterized protein n=1 Tax=Allokutzneria oryzae TaxID=1378989 RepID=A0ABV6A9Z7_9PSEU